MKTIAILGADQSAVRAALLLRRAKQRARILLFPWRSQSPCIVWPIVPYYLRGDVGEEMLFLYTNDMLKSALRIRVMEPIIDVDLDERVVETREHTYEFDCALLSLNEETVVRVKGLSLSLERLEDLRTLKRIIEENEELSFEGEMPTVLDICSAIRKHCTIHLIDVTRYLDEEIREELENFLQRTGISLEGEEREVRAVIESHTRGEVEKILKYFRGTTFEDLIDSDIIAYGSLVPALDAITRKKGRFKEWPTLDKMARIGALYLGGYRPVLRGFIKYYWWRLRYLYLYTIGATEEEASKVYDDITSTRIRLKGKDTEILVKCIAERKSKRIVGVQAISLGTRLDNIFSLLLPIYMHVPLDSIVPLYFPSTSIPFRDAVNMAVDALWRKLSKLK